MYITKDQWMAMVNSLYNNEPGFTWTRATRAVSELLDAANIRVQTP